MENSRIDSIWSAALIRKMARLADREMSAGQIAKTLGLTRGQVLGKMRRLGLKFRNPPTRPPGRDRTGTAGRRNRHATRSRSRDRMQTETPRRPQPNSWPAARTERMIDLVDQGLSHGGIAKALGLTRGQVLGKMRRLGLKTRNAAASA